MGRLSLLAAVLLLGACASSGGLGLRAGPESADTIVVLPVKNLSGVSLKVPEMYVADMAGSVGELNVKSIDLGLLAEAALKAALRAEGLRVVESSPRYEMHAAITEYDASELRRTARYRMGVVVMLVDTKGAEVARGGAVQEFQLFSKPPAETGALGDERFVRRKLEGFTELLVREAVAGMKLR
jgi:hypothetical protein